jgi:hypothetical protein
VFLLVAVPALTALIGARAHTADRKPAAGEHTTVNAAVLGVAALLAAAVIALGWMAPAPSLGWRPIVPRAVDAIASCGAPMYNTYGDGGVLIWFVRQQKVFIDNRQDPYPLDLLVAAHELELDGNYDALFSRYRIRCAVIPPDSPAGRRLGTDAGWSPGYADSHWSVFTKNN